MPRPLGPDSHLIGRAVYTGRWGYITRIHYAMGAETKYTVTFPMKIMSGNPTDLSQRIAIPENEGIYYFEEFELEKYQTRLL